MPSPPDRTAGPSAQWSFSDWAQEYETYDLASLVAEAATLNDREPFNRVAAIFVALVYLATDDPELSAPQRTQSAKLAERVLHDLWATTETDLAARARLVQAVDGTLERVARFTLHPEYAGLIQIPHRPSGAAE